jgi:hypothetical protein
MHFTPEEPTMTRQILAAHDKEGVFVYQAFRPEIVEAALEHGTFGKGFNRERMTWIKPSFGWMLYRSGYATKHRQERILKIKLTHAGFLTMLARGVPTSFEGSLFPTPAAWRAALDRCEVRFQWDPDRDLPLRPLERRAIQLGLAGETVRQYVEEWIVGLEDVTPLARAIQAAVRVRRELPAVPEERVYAAEEEVRTRLGIA